MNNKIVKYSVFLLVLGIVAGFLLGFVNSFTAPIIENRAKEAAAAVLKEHFVYDEFSGSKIEDFPTDNDAIEDIFFTYNDGKLESVIFQTVARGFSSDVHTYVEIKKDGLFGKTVVFKHNDTPGIGDRVEGHDFGNVDKKINDYKLEVISGVTYTSDAVIAGINAAVAHFKTIEGRLEG